MRRHSFIRSRSIVLVAALAAVLAAGGYAFTASNTVPASTAGSGTGTISGYTATSVAYVLTAANPTTLDTLTFTISPTTTSVVKVKAGATGTWKTCTNTAGAVSCDYSAAPISIGATLDNLNVVAVQ